MSNSEDHALIAVSRSTQILEAEPSCIEFAPSERNIFIVGTYHLDTQATDVDAGTDHDASQSQAHRWGQLLVFRLNDESNACLLETIQVEGAVLDLHFSPRQHDLLAVAQSNGVVSLWRLSQTGSGFALNCINNLQLCASADLILSLAWSPGESNELAVTISDGRLIVTELDEHGNNISSCYVQSQSLEAWSLGWPAHGVSDNTSGSERTVYCGGDDAVICGWDLRSLAARVGDESIQAECFLAEASTQRLKGTVPFSCPGLLFDAATHTAGVTAILPLLQPEVVITGSYDEYIRVLAPTERGRWRVLAEHRLDGGVWRLKLLDQNDGILTILASCMHAGTRIVELKPGESEWSVRVMKRFEEHESMNYGSDAIRNATGGFIVVSTSFYDRRLCVWSY